MIIYFIFGLLFTFIFDVILKGGEHEFNNVERIVVTILWPIMLIWFIYFTIKNFLDGN